MRKCLLAGTIYTGRDNYIIYYFKATDKIVIDSKVGKLYEDKIQFN